MSGMFTVIAACSVAVPVVGDLVAATVMAGLAGFLTDTVQPGRTRPGLSRADRHVGAEGGHAANYCGAASPTN